eukprot:4236883-Amphidinium_carterae.1
MDHCIDGSLCVICFTTTNNADSMHATIDASIQVICLSTTNNADPMHASQISGMGTEDMPSPLLSRPFGVSPRAARRDPPCPTTEYDDTKPSGFG